MSHGIPMGCRKQEAVGGPGEVGEMGGIGSGATAVMASCQWSLLACHMLEQ